MKTFKSFNNDLGAVCPICKQGTEKETVLIPIQGTYVSDEESGVVGFPGKGISEAIQVHADCLGEALIYNREYQMIYALCR